MHQAQSLNDWFENTAGIGFVHVLQQNNDPEHHGSSSHHRRANQHRLGSRLEGVARAVALFKLVFGILEIRLEAKGALDLLCVDVSTRLNLTQFIDRLRVVSNWSVTVHGDGYRPHPQKAEGHQSESKNRRGKEEFLGHDRDQGGVGRELPGHKH